MEEIIGGNINMEGTIFSMCSYCKAINSLVWQSDFSYDEVFGEGEGIVSFYTCNSCGAEVQYSLKDKEEDEE